MNDFITFSNLYAYLMSIPKEELNEADKMLRTQLASTLNKQARNVELALDIAYENTIEKDIKMKQEKFAN